MGTGLWMAPDVAGRMIRLGVLGIVLSALWSLSQLNFTLFHTLTEFATILVAVTLFYVGWRARLILEHNYLFGLAILYGTVALIDFLHTITYQGANLFPRTSANLPTQFWILGRYMESLGLAAIFWLSHHGGLMRRLVVVLPAIAAAGVLAIYLGLFPDAYLEGEGLTPFKIYSEYLIIAVLAVAAVGLFSRHSQLSARQSNYFICALFLTALAEFSFTQYASVSGPANITGHLLRLLSCYFIYEALVSDKAMANRGLLAVANVKPLLFSSLIVLTVLWGALAVYQHEYRGYEEDEARIAGKRARDAAAALSIAMQSRLHVIDSLKAFVKSQPDFTEVEFSIFADTLQAKLPEILSLQLAPDGVVTYVTDKARNGAAVGHDLLGDPARRDLARKAIRENAFIIAGPLELIQGGRAIIARQPIFEEHGSADPLFWGFATVLIDIDGLLADALIGEVSEDYPLAIRGADGLGAQGAVFFGDPSVFASAIATAPVDLGSGAWQIAVSHKHQYAPSGFILSPWYWLAVVLFAAATGLLLYRIFNRSYELKAEVARATGKLQAELQRRTQAEQQIKHLANHDPLTGLANRRLFNELAHEALRLADRRRSGLAVYFMDLDGFKGVNDALGHDYGDLLLQQISERLRGLLRQADIIARVGGDEFVVMLTDADGPQPKVAQSIINEVVRPFTLAGQPVSVGISIGIACYPADNRSVEGLLKAADEAMYRAKAAGRNRYRLAGALEADGLEPEVTLDTPA